MRRGYCDEHRRDKARAEPSRQKDRKHHTGSAAWAAIRRKALAAGYHRCASCGALDAHLEVDHVDGDTYNNLPENLQLLCKPCHSRKTAGETLHRGR